MSGKQVTIALAVWFITGIVGALFNAIVGAAFTRGQIYIGYAVLAAVALIIWTILGMREKARDARKREAAVKSGLDALRNR